MSKLDAMASFWLPLMQSGASNADTGEEKLDTALLSYQPQRLAGANDQVDAI